MKYEAIIHQGVLEHFKDKEIINILKIQGKSAQKIIFDVPNNQRKNLEDEGSYTRYESPEFWENIITKAGLKYKRFGRNLDEFHKEIPDSLKEFNSLFMKKVGRSSMFVCWEYVI